MCALPDLQPASKERGERREIGVGAADEDADAFVLFRPVGSGKEGGEGGGAAGFGDDRNVAPEPALGLNDGGVRNENRLRRRSAWRWRS